MPQVRRVRLAAVFTALSAWAAVLGQAPDRCPEPHKLILNEYKRFHDANRNAPDAKYLLNTCWGHCQVRREGLPHAALTLARELGT